MALTEKGLNALGHVKTYFPTGAFSVADLSSACGEKIFAATLNSVVSNGYLNKLGGSPVMYEAIPNLMELLDNMDLTSKNGCNNSNLHTAKKAKNDEFYTRYDDIEAEVMKYRKYFRDKVVYLPCDDPVEKKSEFWSFFVNNFDAFGIKKLIATHYDENGKTIASNSYKYGYRVTNNIHLYAIYGDAKDKKVPGLTVTKNEPDYYVDNGGVKRVRLNTMMNVYNCPDSDKNIKQVSVIYLQDPHDYISNYIKKNNATALANIREKVKDLIAKQSENAQFSNVTIKIDGANDNLAKGLTYDVWSGDSSILTNKNRIQFTTSFRQDLLGGSNYKNLYTFAAMNYSKDDKTEWIVSDNYIKYVFGDNGKVTDDSTQVNSLQ